MKSPKLRLLSVLAAICLSAAVAPAAIAPEEPSFTLSTPRVQEFKPVHFLHMTRMTKLANGQVAKDVREMMMKVAGQIKAGEIRPAGTLMSVYTGNMGNPSQEFKIDVGVPVPADFKAPDGYEISDLAGYKALTFLFSGNYSDLLPAYMQAYQTLGGLGYASNGTSREYHLFSEGETSSNNVAMLQLGIK